MENKGRKYCFPLISWKKKTGETKNRIESFPLWVYFFYSFKLKGKWGGKSDEKYILHKYPHFITLIYPSHFSTIILLYNKKIIVYLYKLHFLSSYFFLQPYKKVFHPSTFSPIQPNKHEEKLNLFMLSLFILSLIFYSFTNFSFSHFFTLPTKLILNG